MNRAHSRGTNCYLALNHAPQQYDDLLHSAVQRLTGYQRRSFMAGVSTTLCDGRPRRAERRFGWGRETAATGLQEQEHGIRCLENFAARAKKHWEKQHPQLAQDIRAIVEPHTRPIPD